MEYRDMSSAEHGSGLHMAEKTGCLSGNVHMMETVLPGRFQIRCFPRRL